MKILFVYDNLSKTGGGSQISSLMFFKEYLKNGFEGKLLTTKRIFEIDPSIDKKNILLCPEINTDFLYPFSLGLPFLTRKLKNAILTFNPDTIHLHEPSPLSLAISNFADQNNIPIIDHYHTEHAKIRMSSFPLSLLFNERGIMNVLQTSAKNQILKRAKKVIVPTEFIKKRLEKKIGKKITIIPYAILDRFFKPLHTTKYPPKKLILISRLERQKRIEDMIHVMKLLKGSYTLDIYGDGPDKSSIKSIIQENNLSEIVTLKGWIAHEDLPVVTKKYDLFVSMSDFETFGITYIESLALGVPCVVYDYYTTREVIPNSMAVFIPSFDPRIWSETLLRLRSNPDSYFRLKKSIKEKYSQLEKYRLKAVIEKMIQVDNSL